MDVPHDIEASPADIEQLRTLVQNTLWEEKKLFKPSDSEEVFVAALSIGETTSSYDSTPGVRLLQMRFENTALSQSYKAFAWVNVRGHVQQEVREGVRKMFSVIHEQRVLEYAKPAVLIKAVHHPDVAVARFAMQKIADVKMHDAVPEVLRVLKESEDETRLLSAVGCVAALKDPRAVDALIALVQHKDPSFVLQVVFAIGAIGGRTAEGFLVTMASGHPIDTVQQAAKDALDEMKR